MNEFNNFTTEAFQLAWLNAMLNEDTNLIK